MKKITAFALILMAFITVEGLAQEKPSSPKETKDGTVDGVKVSVVYCRPSVRGRKIMGDLVPFGQVWRTGANEATLVEFDQPVKIEGKELAAGKYALFTIPGEKEWTIIFNKDIKQWGAYSYKESDDVLRVAVKPGQTEFTETFTIATDKDGLILKWETTSIPVKVKKS